ncbi:MAG TPA: hypothetical protein P5225_00695 [Candidatus Paceibacterota bacterium]|jgi:hypothetical protein|nr:hypothetical protein [Candidatus Paceibacterota bacterium]
MYWRNLFPLVKEYIGKYGPNSVVLKNGAFIGTNPDEPFEEQVFSRIQSETLTSDKPFVIINPDDFGEGLKIDGEKVSITKVFNNQ